MSEFEEGEIRMSEFEEAFIATIEILPENEPSYQKEIVVLAADISEASKKISEDYLIIDDFRIVSIKAVEIFAGK